MCTPFESFVYSDNCPAVEAVPRTKGNLLGCLGGSVSDGVAGLLVAAAVLGRRVGGNIASRVVLAGGLQRRVVIVVQCGVLAGIASCVALRDRCLCMKNSKSSGKKLPIAASVWIF